MILYNITGYGLNGLFFEIQTDTRFPINFNWEISVAWVCTLHEQNLSWGKRSGFFSRNSKVRLPQTDGNITGLGVWGLVTENRPNGIFPIDF